MKRITAIVSILLVISLTACSSYRKSETDTFNDNKDNTIVYGVETDYSEDMVKAINNYLNESGCDYSVEFINIPSIIGKDNNNITAEEYSQCVEEYVDEGNQLDICYTGMSCDQSWIQGYDILSSDGYLQELDSYLLTEEGKSLYESMPEPKWESLKRNGAIYGINGYPYNCRTDISYSVNTELMDKYQITEEELTRPLNEIEDILENVQAGEADNKNFSALSISWSPSYTYNYCADGYIDGVFLDEQNPDDPVHYILDDKEYIEQLRQVYNIINNDLIKADTVYEAEYNNTFLLVNFSSIFPGADMAKNEWWEDKGALLEDNQIVQIYPYGINGIINDNVICNAVLKNSKNKSEAYDYLNKVYSDNKLSDIIKYGADYEIIDGRAYQVNEDGLANTSFPISSLNGFIGTPAGDEYLDKVDRYFKAYEDIKVSAFNGFRFDRSEVQMYVDPTNEVIERIPELFTGKITDFDSFISELRAAYIDNGGDIILDAVKEQWNAFKSKN